jgi:single-strand DNA-binding protein
MLNQSIIMGRLTRDVEITYLQGNDTAVARFSIACERDYQKQGEERQADFISCVAFGKTAEFIGKYFAKGNMICVMGRIQTGSYTNKDGVKVYTTDVNVEKAHFTGEKRADMAEQPAYTAPSRPEPSAAGDEFMKIPEDIEQELPF